jgi:hypothetical protein
MYLFKASKAGFLFFSKERFLPNQRKLIQQTHIKWNQSTITTKHKSFSSNQTAV